MNLVAIFFKLHWISLLPQLLTPSVLIGRLINAHQHLLSLRIAEYLGMNQVSQYMELWFVIITALHLYWAFPTMHVLSTYQALICLVEWFICWNLHLWCVIALLLDYLLTLLASDFLFPYLLFHCSWDLLWSTDTRTVIGFDPASRIHHKCYEVKNLVLTPV